MISASSRRVSDKDSIFDALSQILVVDAAKVIPTVDRALIRDVPESDRRGSLYIPESVQNREPVRQGIVIAVGPGDKYTEHGFDNDGQVRRRQVRCGYKSCSNGYDLNMDTGGSPALCPECGGHPIRLPMPVKVGDRVLYSRRRDLEVSIAGVTYSLVNASQSIYGVVEGA